MGTLDVYPSTSSDGVEFGLKDDVEGRALNPIPEGGAAGEEGIAEADTRLKATAVGT